MNLLKYLPKRLCACISFGFSFNDPNIEAQIDSQTYQHALSISQLLMYNSMIRCRKNKGTTSSKHSHDRETPLPIYLGIMIHTKTRKWELVDQMYEFGLSISYKCVLKISNEIGNNNCQYYKTQLDAR